MQSVYPFVFNPNYRALPCARPFLPRATVYPPRYTRPVYFAVHGGIFRTASRVHRGRLPSRLRTIHFFNPTFVGQHTGLRLWPSTDRQLTLVFRVLLIAQLLRRRADPPRVRRLRHRPRLRPVLLLLHHPPGTSSLIPYPCQALKGHVGPRDRATGPRDRWPPSRDHLPFFRDSTRYQMAHQAPRFA